MKLAQKRAYGYAPTRETSIPIQPMRTHVLHAKAKRVVKKEPLVKSLLVNAILLCIFLFVLPVSFQHWLQPVYKTIFPDKIGKYTDYNYLMNKSHYTVYNDNLFGQRVLIQPQLRKPEMQSIYETDELKYLKMQLNQLIASYPTVKPAIYVWDYKTSKYLNINADKSYSAASIIKIPVLFELFKSIEMGQVKLKDTFTLTDVYRASGSGDLQFKAENTVYSLGTLARLMMRDSDNSATNMIMAAIGGSADVNRALRQWGMKKTHIANWLPDLEGDNRTTAKELATMLLNVDNPKFLSLGSRELVIDYLSDIKNNRLIQAGLPDNALFIHKTGDIGKMLGDAGIVYTPEGEKYIVVILANRPHNAPAGKEFIVQASKLIYSNIVNGKK